MASAQHAEQLKEQHRQTAEGVARIFRTVANETNGSLQFVESNLRFLQLELEKSGPLDGDAQGALAQALRGVQRMAESLRAVQHFAEPGDAAPRKTDVNAALRLALTLARNEISLSADLFTELGELPPVLGHASALHEVFLGLLLHAAHSAASSLERGQVHVSTRADGQQIVISIRGSGTGCASEADQQGLSLAKALVEEHAGQLTTEGATFCVRLSAISRL